MRVNETVMVFEQETIRVNDIDTVLNWIEGWPLGFGRRSSSAG